MKTDKRKTGDLGEDIACRFLIKKGFSIVERNYLKKWGEIDVVAQKDKRIHFLEVKTLINKSDTNQNGFRPEDNVHFRKLERMARTVESYIAERGVTLEFQCDLITVRLDMTTKKAKVEVVEYIL